MTRRALGLGLVWLPMIGACGANEETNHHLRVSVSDIQLDFDRADDELSASGSFALALSGSNNATDPIEIALEGADVVGFGDGGQFSATKAFLSGYESVFPTTLSPGQTAEFRLSVAFASQVTPLDPWAQQCGEILNIDPSLRVTVLEQLGDRVGGVQAEDSFEVPPDAQVSETKVSLLEGPWPQPLLTDRIAALEIGPDQSPLVLEESGNNLVLRSLSATDGALTWTQPLPVGAAALGASAGGIVLAAYDPVGVDLGWSEESAPESNVLVASFDTSGAVRWVRRFAASGYVFADIDISDDGQTTLAMSIYDGTAAFESLSVGGLGMRTVVAHFDVDGGLQYATEFPETDIGGLVSASTGDAFIWGRTLGQGSQDIGGFSVSEDASQWLLRIDSGGIVRWVVETVHIADAQLGTNDRLALLLHGGVHWRKQLDGSKLGYEGVGDGLVPEQLGILGEDLLFAGHASAQAQVLGATIDYKGGESVRYFLDYPRSEPPRLSVLGCRTTEDDTTLVAARDGVAYLAGPIDRGAFLSPEVLTQAGQGFVMRIR